MKIMDYMCCAVPVCSLPLKEQVYSTQGIAIHANTFEGIARKIAEVYKEVNEYEGFKETDP